MSRQELLSLCKLRGLKGYSNKSKQELLQLLQPETAEPISENDQYIYQTMLTCIGNKRKLISHIIDITQTICAKLGKPKLHIMDAFAGSGVVSRALGGYADTLISNDLELYSALMLECYIKTPSPEQQIEIARHIQEANRLAECADHVGIITTLYAPQDTEHVQMGERCFYTHENALRIDTIRHYIETAVPTELKPYLLVPLLNKASIHTNTAGVFKGFYKNHAGLGCFGGEAKVALSRIMKPITLDMPIWNTVSPPTHTIVYNRDINVLLGEMNMASQKLDMIYLDPPYNQHPYGSNYFMLNVIATNQAPAEISRVSGIPVQWNKSAYNAQTTAVNAMKQLLELATRCATYVVLSYNNEGIISPEQWEELFQPYIVEKREITYDTFKGSRNLKERDNKVIEIFYTITVG